MRRNLYGKRPVAPAPNSPAPPFNSNFFYQNPAPYPYYQNFNHPYHQNPNNFYLQNPAAPPFQTSDYYVAAHHATSRGGGARQRHSVDKVDAAVIKSRREIVASGESVSSWKVVEAVLLKLQVQSWSFLGFQMEDVPSLNDLMAIEGKINTFVDCFVGVRQITSLYDLEMAICKSEGVEHFDELELGPLLQHPLVVHYFSVRSDVTHIHRISTEHILLSLSEFMDVHCNKKIEVLEFLDFLAKKQSVTSREMLCIRIQNLGMHISLVRAAKRTEKYAVKKTFKPLIQKKYNTKKKLHVPILSSQKMELDERFSALSQRVRSFSSSYEDLQGKKIIFISSCSEAEESDDKKSEDESSSKLLPHRADTSDRVNSCPYPSATEEMSRLGMKEEMYSTPSTDDCKIGFNANPSTQKKRKLGCRDLGLCYPSKLPKRDKLCSSASNLIHDSVSRKITVPCDHAADNNSIRAFITTWKEACYSQTASEVFTRMLCFYDTTLTKLRRRSIRRTFSSNPCAALLNIALASMKYGLWDTVFDTCQSCSICKSIEAETNVIKAMNLTDCVAEQTQSLNVTVDEIMKKIITYPVPKNEDPSGGNSNLGTKFRIFRTISSFEHWLIEQFSVNEFKNLGHGEFSEFLERNASLIPSKLLNQLVGNESAKPSMEVSMRKNQLDLFLLQAINSLSENGIFTRQKIYELLTRQFPSISFNVLQHGCANLLTEKLREERNRAISKRLLFSMTLMDLPIMDDAVPGHDNLPDFTYLKADWHRNSGVLGHKTSKDAIETLLKAPMLFDLHTWSHWDVVFFPSLGHLVGWILDEVRSEELLCLVTTGGIVIRINHLATTSSFLEAACRGSAFHTAVELISLFSLIGRKKHVPMFLIKNYAQQAFKAILKNATDDINKPGMQIFDNLGKSPSGAEHFDDAAARILLSKPCKAVTIASRFILDCLAFVPSEFREFVTDVLLSGLSYFVKSAPVSILHECQKTYERVMLHEIGLSLGITEWVEDHQQFSLNTKEISLNVPISEPESARHGKFPNHGIGTTEETPCKILEATYDEGGVRMEDIPDTSICANTSCDRTTGKPSKNPGELYSVADAEMIIESIRQEEFGLDSNRPEMQNTMLFKQHERLGRALQCLSQELYSQDSHFLLELVQNADDNLYPKNVEPTLIFILQETGIVVLNNEHGFSAQNIRALCDIANSTKTFAGPEYIGKKGIGFKSVFRVTDAPEIHSNNFHLNFDITKGRIGFVCPTVVPPCDIEMFTRLACDGTDKKDSGSWRTCIVLPFSSKVSGTAASIVPMFADLHPSLLLFLHRLRCIKLRNMLDDSLIVMKKEIAGNGIIKVSHGVEEMTWLVVSQQMQAALGANSKTTEISVAFTLLESPEGYYVPCLNLQPVFAYLPLRTYGLKFIIQGDFVLPSSREGVDADSLWNQWLLSEFPNLFVNAEKSFCGIPCFRDNPGKAVTAYMSFIPLVGEVHGFFSNLPRMIIAKLRVSSCLLKEGDNCTWVPPCKLLRNWSDRALNILPDSLLRDHLGKAFLNRDISLSDSLSEALGLEEYGPNVLLRILMSLCYSGSGLRSVGFEWLCAFLGELYDLLFLLHGSVAASMDMEITDKLQKIPFIPLSDGNFSSVDEGAIWMHFDFSTLGHDKESSSRPQDFPYLYAKLRTVSSTFLALGNGNASGKDMTLTEKISILLRNIGVQRLSAHDIIKVHILPAIADEKFANENMTLMTEYLSFVMVHLQSSCTECITEKQYLVSELRCKALVLTNYGYKRPNEVSIHFSKEYESTVDVTKLINAGDFQWCEIDGSYLKHSITESLPRGQIQWRDFFSDLGVTDFVRVTQVRKNLKDIPSSLLKILMPDKSTGLLAIDWESNELVQLLSSLSNSGSRDNCIYMLKILDTMWDKYYEDKVSGYWNTDAAKDRKPFTSSFVRSFSDLQWVVSSIDDILCYPKDLFHDCAAVRTILGSLAPYAVPKVNNEALLKALGLRTQVILDDILAVCRMWRRSAGSFKASIEQMSRLYTFIWNETCSSKQKVLEELLSGPFIFVPELCDFKHADLVSGTFLSAKEVSWHGLSGSMILRPTNQNYEVKEGFLRCSPKVLGNIYPGLHDFFVKECGVNEVPPLHDCLDMLLQFTECVLPSQAAKSVLQVFMKWADEYESGVITSKEIDHLKKSLLEMKYKILPAEQDKWVSLHPSYGFLCWSDDENLKKEFKHLENLNFICFGEDVDDKNKVFRTKMHILLNMLGIPALSQVVTREAIFYGVKDSNIKSSLVNWALPFAQRYMYNMHPEKYSQLKNSICQDLGTFRVVVVEKLFYKNVLKRCALASKNRSECDSLLQDNSLYTTDCSDVHSLFMELSRLFFEGTCELHLANFLHMITTMAGGGFSEEHAESFILNSQKFSKVPSDEIIWSLASLSSTDEIEEITIASGSKTFGAGKISTLENKSGPFSCWPPADWKTSPGFKFARENVYRTQTSSQPSHSSLDMFGDHPKYVDSDPHPSSISDTGAAWIFEGDGTIGALTSLNLEALGVQPNPAFNQAGLSINLPFDNIPSNFVHGGQGTTSTKFDMRSKLNTGNPNSGQALLTGRLGESVAYNYFLGKTCDAVNWVNKDTESGLPYDIVIGEGGNNVEFIEVKATRSARKDWFMITTREWQYAIEKGESFSIAHVVLQSDNTAKISTFKNPAKLVQLGKLQLVVMMPKV